MSTLRRSAMISNMPQDHRESETLVESAATFPDCACQLIDRHNYSANAITNGWLVASRGTVHGYRHRYAPSLFILFSAASCRRIA